MKTYRVSNSERVTHDLCTFRWLLRDYFGLRPDTLSVAVSTGNLWHRVMDTWWEHVWTVSLDRHKVLVACYDTIRKWRLQRTPSEGFGTEEPQVDPKEVDKVAALVTDMVQGYTDRYLSSGGLPDHWREGSVSMIEEPVVANTRTATGRRSPVTVYQGITDKVIWHGEEAWILDHKSTSKNLHTWIERHGHSPQLVCYAWALRQKGVPVVGICYDLALTKPEPTWKDVSVVKKGDRLSKVVPAGLSAEHWQEAIKRHGFSMEDHDWYSEVYQDLANAPDRFFNREFYRLNNEEIDLVGRELYVALGRIRQDYILAEELTGGQAMDEEGQKDLVASFVQEHGWRFPRRTDGCYAYFKPCPYMSACRLRNRESLDPFAMVDPDQRYKSDDEEEYQGNE